jgi:hypothetical protein
VKDKLQQRLGLSAILVSCALWATVAIIPLLALGSTQTTIAIAVSLLVSELLFWLGILLVGKQIAERYRQQLDPRYWLNKLKNRN